MPAVKDDPPNKLLDLLKGDTSASHSREKISLCCEIILDHFGPVAAQISCALLQRGRLTLRELSRFLATPTLHAPTGYTADLEDVSKADGVNGATTNTQGAAEASSSAATTSATLWHTPLRSQRLIQQTLLTLIQHNICWHVCLMPDGTMIPIVNEDRQTGEEEGASRGTEYFQINVEEVLPRLRFGTYLDTAETEFGIEGFRLIEFVLHHGKLRVSDLISRILAVYPDMEQSRLEDCIRDLLFYAYVQPSLIKTHTSPRDRRIAFEGVRVSQSKKFLTEKEKKIIAEDAKQMLIDDDRQIWFSEPGVRRGLLPASEQTRKRKLAAPSRRSVNGKGVETGSTKKQKGKNGVSRASQILAELDDEEVYLNGNGVNGSTSQNRESFAIDPTIFIRVNFDRFDVHVRDEMIVQAVASRYNAPLASIMQNVLHLQRGGYDRIPQARELHSDVIQTDLLHSQLPIDVSFKGIFDVETMKKKLGSSKNVTQAALLTEALAVLLGDGDDSSVGCSRRFLGPYAGEEGRMSSSGGGGGVPSYGKIQIEYANAGRAMRQQILSNVVDAQFGQSAVRVVSLLTRMGKLDEKQISKVCLVSMSETRDVCARLFAAGILSLQEVPKASERTATRSYFFWYVDHGKCLAWLSDRLCKTLARLAQRRRHELVREADLIDKAGRLAPATSATAAAAVDLRSENVVVGLRDVERLRLKRVRDTVDMFILAETRTMRDLFVVANLAE